MAGRRGIRLSVVIVSYGNEAVVRDCLDSIERFNDIGEALEVIVVEQTEDRPEIANHLATGYPWAHVVRNPNRGFGAGNNRGVRESSGDLLLFLNPDTILLEPVFGRAVDIFDGDAKLGLFGVSLVTRDGEPNQSFYYIDGRSLWSQVKYQVVKRLGRFNQKSMYITGADMFTRREAFGRSGGFDERFFMYFEEPDLCRRIRACGYTIEFHPEMRIVHLEGKSSGASSAQAGCMIDSLKLYCEKYGLDYARELRRWWRSERIVGMAKRGSHDRDALLDAIEGRLGQETVGDAQ